MVAMIFTINYTRPSVQKSFFRLPVWAPSEPTEPSI
jgi:hypothetical protein